MKRYSMYRDYLFITDEGNDHIKKMTKLINRSISFSPKNTEVRHITTRIILYRIDYYLANGRIRNFEGEK